MAGFFKELGVSAQQTAAIQKIHAQAQPQIEAARTTLQSDHTNLHEQVASSAATDAQLMTLYNRVTNDAAASMVAIMTDEDSDDSGVFAWFEPGISVD